MSQLQQSFHSGNMRTQDSKPYPEKETSPPPTSNWQSLPKTSAPPGPTAPGNKECWDDLRPRAAPSPTPSERHQAGAFQTTPPPKENAPAKSASDPPATPPETPSPPPSNYPASRRHIPCPNAIQPSRQQTDAPKARSLALLAQAWLARSQNTESPPAIPTRRNSM